MHQATHFTFRIFIASLSNSITPGPLVADLPARRIPTTAPCPGHVFPASAGKTDDIATTTNGRHHLYIRRRYHHCPRRRERNGRTGKATRPRWRTSGGPDIPWT